MSLTRTIEVAQPDVRSFNTTTVANWNLRQLEISLATTVLVGLGGLGRPAGNGFELHRWVFALHLRDEIGNKLPPDLSSALIVQTITWCNPAIDEVVWELAFIMAHRAQRTRSPSNWQSPFRAC